MNFSGTLMAALFSGLVFFSSAVMAAQDRGWNGTYTYDFDGGKNVGGTGQVVNYTLTLDPVNAKMPCTLDIVGTQTDEHILCSVVENAGQADILFKTFSDGRIVNGNDIAIYKPGDLLFTLMHGKKNKSIVTRWNKITPAEKVVKGKYFVKAVR